MPGRRQDWHHPSIQKRPRRLSVKHQYRIRFGGAVFHPGDPQMSTITVGDIAIICAIREFGQIAKAFVGRAQTLHDREHTEQSCRAIPLFASTAHRSAGARANFSPNRHIRVERANHTAGDDPPILAGHDKHKGEHW
jgi:hypothetical protein